ncbi:MAG: type II secretion system protein, partial [Pseudomonadota bacterium]
MDRQAGFSLVELLVVMTLLAFLSAILLGSLRFGARSWEGVLAATDRRDSIAAAHRFLRARVGGLVRSGTAGAWAGAPEIAGDAREIRFTAPWLEALGHGGAYRFRLWQ